MTNKEIEPYTITPEEFNVGAGCNVFHWEDVGLQLEAQEKLFAITMLKKHGRTKEQVLTINPEGHTIEIRACGYGTGDYIRFDGRIDETLRTEILKGLARHHAVEMATHAIHVQRYAQDKQEIAKLERQYAIYMTFARVVREHVQTLEELKTLADYINIEKGQRALLSLSNEKLHGKQCTKKEIDDYKRRYEEREKVLRHMQKEEPIVIIYEKELKNKEY